jgi:hypothetical protein
VWLCEATPNRDWTPGEYYVKRKPHSTNKQADDTALAAQLVGPYYRDTCCHCVIGWLNTYRRPCLSASWNQPTSPRSSRTRCIRAIGLLQHPSKCARFSRLPETRGTCFTEEFLSPTAVTIRLRHGVTTTAFF